MRAARDSSADGARRSAAPCTHRPKLRAELQDSGKVQQRLAPARIGGRTGPVAESLEQRPPRDVAVVCRNVAYLQYWTCYHSLQSRPCCKNAAGRWGIISRLLPAWARTASALEALRDSGEDI